MMLDHILALTEQDWIAVGAVAASIAALPAAYGTFVWLRGIVRKIKAKWHGWIKSIEDRAIAKANEEREIKEGLEKAEREAEQRKIRHAEADAKQEQYNRMVIDLDERLTKLLNPQTQTIVATVKEESGKAVTSAGESKKELSELRQDVTKLAKDFGEHKVEDRDSFTKGDAKFAKIFEKLGIPPEQEAA